MTPSRSGTSPFREWRRKQAYNLLPFLTFAGIALFRMFGVTLRTRFSGHLPVLDMVRSGEPFVLAFFHGRLFLLVNQLRGWPLVVMLSISYLGEIQSRILESFGYATIRGSRSRGGSRVLAEMIVHVRKRGRIGVFAVDGPRGPYREVKPGVVFVAKKLGVPIVPVTSSARPSVILGWLWDRFLLPVPFARATVHLGEPIMLDDDLSESSISDDCRRIEHILENLETEADALVGRTEK
jgi:lysophospholipid acyltransferase (LPLAT)-like uncharacterized protein